MPGTSISAFEDATTLAGHCTNTNTQPDQAGQEIRHAGDLLPCDVLEEWSCLKSPDGTGVFPGRIRRPGNTPARLHLEVFI